MVDMNDFSGLVSPSGTPILRLHLLSHPSRYLVREGRIYYTKLTEDTSLEAAQWSIVRCILMTDLIFIGRQEDSENPVQIVGCLPLVNIECKVAGVKPAPGREATEALILRPVDGNRTSTIAFTFTLDQETMVWYSDIHECIRRTEAAIADATSGAPTGNWCEKINSRHGAPAGIGLKDLIRVDG